MNIAFVANGQKTAFFHKIGLTIQKNIKDVELYYICFTKKQMEYYSDEGIKSDHILYLSLTNAKSKLEIGQYRLNEIIAYDRAMKYNFDRSLNFMIGCETLFYDFVKNLSSG